MADFLRPQARATLWRLRGVAVALAPAALGLWIAATTFGLTRWLGWALVALGAALALAALQRLRFGLHDGGPGVVQIDERRLSYFGPLTGGVIDLDDLTRLGIDGSSHPPHWLLTAPGAVLAVPVNAAGAEALFDAFAALPGLSPERLIAAVNAPPPRPATLWEAARHRLR
jgi:hypothetical protein